MTVNENKHPDDTKKITKKTGLIAQQGIAIFALLIACSALFFSLLRIQTLEYQQNANTTALTHQNQSNIALVRQLAMLRTHLDLLNDNTKKSNHALIHLQQRINLFDHDSTLAQKKVLATFYNCNQLLTLANINIIYTKNFQAALELLTAVDNELKNLDDPNLIPVRQTIANDRDKIQNIALPDPVLILSTLTTLENRIGLVSSHTLSPSHFIHSNHETNNSTITWKNKIAEVLNNIRGYVVIRYHDKPIQPVWSPAQSILFQQNIHVFIQQAKIATLQQNQGLFDDALKQLNALVTEHCDTRSAQVMNIHKTLSQLRTSVIVPDAFNVNDAIVALKLVQKNYQDKLDQSS